MRHGSLFSGIGGFDLAAEWMGWENVFHCEWNPFGQKVLKHYWPNSISYNDITKTDFSIHRGAIDILTGGFPCQPYSSAGKRLGKEDERHLWPKMLRAIREIQPRWIVGENVLGLVNWNGGMVFEEVQADLEAERYEVQPYVLPAAAVNAPHRRDRVWFVAYASLYANRLRTEGRLDLGGQLLEGREGKKETNGLNNINKNEPTSDSNSNRLEGCISTIINRQPSCKKEHDEKCLSIDERRLQFKNFPTVSPICDGNDGLSNRLDGITFPKWRNESIKAGGNAIVPQVVFQIFKAIELYGIQNTSKDQSTL
jgi:DNA (cytosine-5)-methyltransferase 1